MDQYRNDTHQNGMVDPGHGHSGQGHSDKVLPPLVHEGGPVAGADHGGMAISPHASHSGPAVDQPMAVVVGGEAVATGYNTAANGVIDNVVEALPGATIAEGEVIFDAVGLSAGHGNATAHTDAFVDVTGADFLFEVEINVSGHGAGGAWSETEIEYVAIDIPNWRPPGGHTITDAVMLNLNHAGPPANDMGALSGNVATMLASADASGPNTSASTLTQAYTVEHHQSVVSGLAFSVA